MIYRCIFPSEQCVHYLEIEMLLSRRSVRHQLAEETRKQANKIT